MGLFFFYGARAAKVCAVLVLIVALVFAMWPSLDLSVSALFLDAEGRFGWRTDPDLRGLREVGMALPYYVVVAFLVSLLAVALFRGVRLFADARKLVAVLLVFALGPGLLVNGILKEFWDRPRPNQVIEFGGDWAFKPWYDPTGECRRNCSFVSGEASSVTALVAAAAALPAPLQAPAVALAAAFAVLISGLRLGFGGHFLSDILFAMLFTHLIACAAFRIMLDERYPWGRPGAIEAWLARRARWGQPPPS
jgi:lipid A 4'-phosphatase